MDYFYKLYKWFYEHCNGDWEHDRGIDLLLKNNTWSVSINLTDTEMEGKKLDPLIIKRSNLDWVSCYVEDDLFKINCYLTNLEEGLNIFFCWAENDNFSG